MTTFPGSPRLIKGAIVGIDIFNPLASVILFQYNPDTLTRRPQMAGEGGAGSEALRLKGAPEETSVLTLKLMPRTSLKRQIAMLQAWASIHLHIRIYASLV